MNSSSKAPELFKLSPTRIRACNFGPGVEVIIHFEDEITRAEGRP